jgi:Uma2 family endonuclease
LIHHIISGNAHRVLDRYNTENEVGYVFMDGLICVFERYPNGTIKKSRVPDTAFIRNERMPDDLSRPFEGAPDLVIEVISPGNNSGEMMTRVREYLANGGEEVWLLYSTVRELHRHRRDDPKTVQVYRDNDVLEPESLFPGLKIVIADLFNQPAKK